MMKRRSFLQNILAAGLFGSLPGRWAGLFSTEEKIFAVPDLLNIIKDPLALKEIGQAYFQLHPHHQDKTLLIRRIQERIGIVKRNPLSTVISNKVTEDFSTGDTIQLNGWILSRTEAQQCALFTMTHQ